MQKLWFLRSARRLMLIDIYMMSRLIWIYAVWHSVYQLYI